MNILHVGVTFNKYLVYNMNEFHWNYQVFTTLSSDILKKELNIKLTLYLYDRFKKLSTHFKLRWLGCPIVYSTRLIRMTVIATQRCFYESSLFF